MRTDLIILGTGSDVGKTTLVTGICRAMADAGLKTAPFKSQNMSLNSCVTACGSEIARATAVQAHAAGQQPMRQMNPILLKPKSDTECQLIIHGQSVGDFGASQNFFDANILQRKQDAISESINTLQDEFDIVVAEGAGSCAEPNFIDVDIVNFFVAEKLNARVLIVGDIDFGGIFAQFLGTYQILKQKAPDVLERVDGFVINKFRGDRSLLQDGLDFHNKVCPIPIVGIVPMIGNLRLEEEDRLRIDRCENPEIRIAIPYLPRISNANDFDVLRLEAGVDVHIIRQASELGRPDAVIIPGTKNTVADLAVLRDTGIADAIMKLPASTPVIGVCGGFEMLGTKLHDPRCVESQHGTVDGLGLLNVEFEFVDNKVLRSGTYRPSLFSPFRETGEVRGYEIHNGRIKHSNEAPLFHIGPETDGAAHRTKPVFGTFIHDLFRNPEFCRSFVNFLRKRRGLDPVTGDLVTPDLTTEMDLQRLSTTITEAIPLIGQYQASAKRFSAGRDDNAHRSGDCREEATIEPSYSYSAGSEHTT